MAVENTPREVFVVFQGGGAKGIAHIGGVKALEEAHIAIRGVGGTSAGAIVASLVAAGYSADEIFATDGSGNHLLMRINAELRDATKLFGVRGWSRLAWLNDAVAWAKEGVHWRRVTNFAWHRWHRDFIAVGACVFVLVAMVWEHHPFALAWVLFAMTWAGLALGGVGAWRLYRLARSLSSGLAKTDSVREVINKALIQKLKEKPSTEPGLRMLVRDDQWAAMEERGITFKEFEQLGGRALCVVATDITSRDVQPFSAHATPDVVVADAVCASIGLPLIFELKHIEMGTATQPRRCYYLDGGLLSNLPLWVFDEDRLLQPRVATIGFTLAESSADNEAKSEKAMAGLSWVAPAINTIVAGPSRIHRRGIDGLILIEIPTALGVLAFDGTNDDYRREVTGAYAAASAQLKLQFDFPKQLQRNLSDIQAELIAAFDALGVEDEGLDDSSFALKDDSGSWDLRVSIAVQREGMERVLRVDASTFRPQPGGPSRVTLLDMKRSIAGGAWASGGALVFFDPADDSVTPGAKWQIAVPIPLAAEPGEQPIPFDPLKPAVVLIVESSWLTGINEESDEFDDGSMERLFAALGFATEKALDAFCLAFLRNMKYEVDSKGPSAKDEPKHIVQFADQARQARLWQ